jgi:large subunit ribosomal protein L18
MDRNKRRVQLRHRRHRHVRARVEGTPERPRLCVFRSHKQIYAQIIDDWNQRTLTSASSLSPELADQRTKGGNIQGAAMVGALIGRKCLEQGITEVVFDRGGYRYHGRVKALAEAARKQFQDAGAAGF